MPDWIDAFNEFFGSPFTCEVCKNDKIYLKIECVCKETFQFCVPCMMSKQENFDSFEREIRAHSRLCKEFGRAVVLARFIGDPKND